MSNPFDQFDAATPQGDSNPFDQFDAGKKKDSRSAVGEIANQFKAGILVDLPKMAGQALKYTSDPGNKVYEAGQGITDWADEQGKRPDLAPQEDQHNIVTNALASGARMIPQSVAPAAAVGAGILALPASIPATVGLGAASVLGAVPAAMSQGQETLEKAREKGVPEDQALAAARSNALIEGGGEALGTYTGGKLLGIAGKTAGKMFGRTAGDALADQTSTAITKPFLKQLGETALVETGTEIGQNAGEAAVENAYGIDSKTPYQAGKEAIAPTLGMTALLAPFGLAGFAHAGKKRGERTDALSSADTSPEDRQKIAGEFAAEIGKVDEQAAANFMANAQYAIDGKQALSIGESMFLPPVAAEETPAPLALPAPTYTGTPSDQVMAAEVERQNQADAAQKKSDALYAERAAFEQSQNLGIAAAPVIPVVGTLSAAANLAVQSGAHAAAVAQQAAENTTPEGKGGTPAGVQTATSAPVLGALSGIAALAPTQPQGASNVAGTQSSPQGTADVSPDRNGNRPLGGNPNQVDAGVGKAGITQAVAPDAAAQQAVVNAASPAQVAKEAPQANAPKAGTAAAPQAAGQGQGIDLRNRTNVQLNYLTQHGQNGHKEAAVAELAKRSGVVAAPKATPLHTSVNEETGMEASVFPGQDGKFNVVQKDTESGESVPTVKIFDTLEAATEYAKTIKPEVAPGQSAQQQPKESDHGQAKAEVLKQPGAVSNAAPAEDPIGWTRMTTVQRESLVSRSGWAGKTRGLNLGGVRVARTAWGDMTEANKAKLIAGNQNTIKNETPTAATVPTESAAPKQEPIKNEDDWLGALFGAAPTAEESANKEAQATRQAQDKADRADAAIAMLTGEIEASNAAAAEVAARNYKSNRKQIELKGDGPGKNGSLSISAINESRKRRTVEALQNASSSIKQAIEFIAENPDGAFKQVADMEAAVTKQFNEGFFGPSAKLDGQLDMAVGSLIGSGSYSGEGSAGRKLRMAAHAYASVDPVSQPKTDTAPEAAQDKAPVSTPQPDAALQNRDRGRAASVNQMQSIARNPDYMRLGPSRTPDSGAPMVFAVGGDTNKIQASSFGANDIAVMSDGQRVPFRYAVVDASSVEPSNFADGAANPAFASMAPGTIKALNNGRTAGVRAAHEGRKAANYTAELLADQAHGVSPEAIRSTPNPMLVRVYAEQANTGDMAAKSQGQGLGMSASERATQDAELMTSEVLDKFAPGDIASAGNRDFVRAFVGKLAENELADMMDATGNLSQDGRRRIEAALLTAAYGKSDLVQELFESTDTDIKAIGNALKVMSGQWASMRNAAKDGVIDPDTDMTANLIEAVNIVRRSRAEGSSIAELAGQGDLMGGNYLNELSELFLRIFYKGKNYDRARGGDKVIAALQEIVTSAMNTKAEAGLFGDSFKATPKQIVESARSKIDEENKPASQSSLFGANGQATAVSQGNRSEGAAKSGEVGQRPVGTGRSEETGKQAEPVERSISDLQKELESAKFGERTELNGILIERVSEDAERSIKQGEMPMYQTGQGTFVALHPSAQQDGMIQATRYSDTGVFGDSQYKEVKEAVRDNGLWFKRRLPDAEAARLLEQSIAAEAEYQKRKNGASEPVAKAAEQSPAVDSKQSNDADLESRILIAADSIDKLRKVDVERVLMQGNIDRKQMADYIKRKRPEFSAEVDSVIEDATVEDNQKSEALDREMAGFTGVNDAEYELRQLSRKEKRDGDIELGNGKFVTLEQAVAAAKMSMDPADWIKPFQFNRQLDIAPIDWNTMVEAMKSESVAVDAEKPAETKPPEAVESSEPAMEPTWDSFADFWNGLLAGKASIDDVKESFSTILDRAEEFKASIAKLKNDQLKRMIGGYVRPDDKKADLVAKVYERTLGRFTLNKDVPSKSWMFGDKMEKVEREYNDKLRAIVNGLTDADLAEFIASNEEFKVAQQKRISAQKATIAEPKTAADFELLLRAKKAEGMTFAEARMSLTPEQRAEYDRLRGSESRDQRKARADQQKTDVRVASQTTDGQIVETKHTKTGEPLFVVKAAERVERDIYTLWNATAKRMGGYYSAFRGNGAVPGFQFKARDSADAFLSFIGGNAEAAKEVVQERRDAFADDRSQTAVERLNEMAVRLEDRADESLGRERKANTERRARFAASAEAAANADKAMATTMRRIAGAIDNGTAQFLDRVRQKAQIEYLTSALRTAKGIELRAKYPNYSDQQRHEGEPATGETADYAEFPQYAMMRSDLANLARKMVALPNMKMLGQRILKAADDTSTVYNAFAKEHLLEVSKFGKADGSGWATFSTLKDAERSIEVSNLVSVAVPLQIKRGEYRIVLSPSEAINRGIWKGDDRKMTLAPDIGAEIVEKLGRLNRKIGQRRGMDAPPAAPWQFENAHNNLKRLAGMGIEQPWEFRAALREFASLKEAPKEADKIKAMELAMIGRKNDGLDFFPTPAGTAQAMIDAAEITEAMSVLEPSAGMGHIAEQIRDVAGVDPDVIEFNSDRRELLEAKGFNVVGSDFLEADGRYDRIIMNPPFSDRRDAEHVQHAYTLLKPGGRIVSIMGEGVFFGQDKKAVAFREWLEAVGGTSEKLEDGTFLDPSLPVNTATNARMVVIEKPEGVSAPADNEGAGNIAATGTISPADKAIYGMAAEGKSVAEILKFIASASRNPFYRQLAKLLQKTGIAPSVTVGDGKGWKMNAGEGHKYAAAYNPKMDAVSLFRPASAERHVLHELMHAATLKALAKNGLASAQMKSLFAHIKKSGALKGMYGMSDIDEFVAEAFSNPKFQDMLKKVAAPTATGGKLSSAWDWFVRVVRGILGLKQNDESALAQALEVGVGVMRENMRLNSGRENGNVGSMADKDTVAGTQAPTSAGDGSIERVVDVSGNGNRVQYFNDKKGTFVESQKYPTGKVKWMAGEVIDGQPQWFSAELFDTKEDAERSIRGSKAKERYNQKYGSIPNVWQGEAKKAAKAIIDAGFSVDRFSSSTQSRSKYIYLENGLKIRLADHALPISYDSPDIDFRYGDDIKSLVNEISKATEGAPTPDSAATRLPGAPDQAGMQERPKAEHAQSTGGAGSDANLTLGREDGNGIRYNVADEGWSVSEPSKMDDLIYALQDKQIDMKRVVQSIMRTGKKVKDEVNAYLQEELFHGRAAKGVKDFLDFELRPLLKQMQEAKVDMGDFEEYLWNRHAEERNKQIAKINPDMPDGGSGIETAKARAYLAGLSAEQRKTFEALAAKVETMNRESQRVLVESGLEKQSTIDAWNGAYQHYVPLQREDVDSGHVGTGKGFSVRGSSSKRAMGSGKKVVDIIANLTMQRERNIVRAEKNRVSNALLGLAVQNPNPDFWKVDQAPKERVVQEKAIYTVLDSAGNKIEEFTRMDDAERLANKTPGASIDQTWGDRVTERVTPGFTSRDNVLLTRINGEDHYVIFNERDERAMRMATAMKNLDMDNLGRVLSVVGKATRYLSAINTQYNPVFGVINLIRDAQGALINLSSTPLAGEQKRVLGYTKDALVGIYKDIRAHRAGGKPSSNWAALFEEFQKEGGQTGYRDQYANAEARAESIKSELEQFKDGKAKQLARGLFGWLSDYNETMENAVRLAAYKAAKEKGMSKQQAASLAKNITVNFNRKGQMATQVGSLYAFFNASVQGTARIAGTLFDMKDGDIRTARLSSTGKKIVYGGIMLGSMQALLLAAAGFGDDEPPDFIKERNLILPIGDGKYLTLAMPLGYHVFPGIGRLATEFVLSGGKDPLKKIAAFGSMFAEALNPIGNSGFSLQTITPSVIDPLAALAENRDFTGKEIYQNDFNKLNPTPGFTRAKDTATAWSKAIAEGLNFITGGTDYKPGLFTPTPDQIDYLIGQVTGGVGREVGKVSQVVSATTTGEDLPIYKVPLVGRFVGDTQGKSGESAKFYNSLREINMHEAEYKGLIGDGKRQEAAEYLAENPAVKLIMLGNQSERAVKKLKEAKRNLIENDAPQEKVAAMEDQIAKSMKLFNDRVTKALAQ